MGHATHLKYSPTLWKSIMLITSQAHLTTHNQMHLLKNVFSLWRSCFIRLKMRKGLIQMFNGIPQYSIVKHFAVTCANPVKQICKIRPSYLKFSQKTNWNRLQRLENKVQKWTFAITWSPYIPSGHVSRFHKQMLVSSHNNKTVQRTQMFHNYNKRYVQDRNTQAHLKPYQPQDNKSEDTQVLHSNHMWTVKFLKSQNINNLAQSRPKRDIKPPIQLDL